MRARFVAGSLVAFLAISASWAQTPLSNAFTYQGQLQNGGSPAGGSFNMVFKQWNDPTLSAPANQIGPTLTFDGVGGHPPPVSVTNGLFTVQLDFGAGAFNGDKRWLEISVAGTLLVPRQELTAAPNAVYALNAGRLDGLDSTVFLQSIPVPLTLSGTSATDIIRGQNTSTANFTAGVHGLSTAGSGLTYGLYGQSDSTDGSGVFGYASAGSGATYGLYGQSVSTAGYGAFAFESAASGTTYGVYGRSASTGGYGVFGLASAVGGSTYGGYFESDSPDGRGVSGLVQAASGTNYGGYFQSASTDGLGVFGLASAASGITHGVRGESASTTGRGVLGYATATSGVNTGGYFQSNSTSGRGVFGYVNAQSGTNYGVYGQATMIFGAWGVYSNGNLGSSGTKPFRIDHPDDPTNKYLLHYAAESPEVINFYSGKATLDATGQAMIELPHYFAKINKDPRYTLTAIGAPMPMLHVAEEIDEAALSAGAKAGPGDAAPVCFFRIAGGVPGAKVSWEVKAVRNDRWVQQCGAPVEVEKQDLEKGTYQHPELYGQPPEKGMNYDATREHLQPSRAVAVSAAPSSVSPD